MFKCLFLFFLLILCSMGYARSDRLSLPAHSDYATNIVKLNDADRLWLAKKGTLTIGLYGSLRPPLSLINGINTLSGINAEYILLLKENLKTNIDVKYYTSIAMLNAAIKSGEVDLVLPSLIDQRITDPTLITSRPLIYSYPSLIARKEDSMRPFHTDDEVTLAVAGDYPDRGFIRKLFKNATIVEFDDVFQALCSVDNGGSDFYFGNNLEAGYFLFFDFDSSLDVIKTWNNDRLTVSFVMRKNNLRLISVINAFVDSITPKIQSKIVESWMGFGNISFYGGPLPLTTQEEKWIENNKKVRVIINPYHFPFTMVDANMDIRGITGDILDLAHMKTGLEFEPVIAKSNKDIAELISKGGWDLHPAAVYSEERSKKVLFTHSFLSTPFVIVVKEDGNTFYDINPGMRIAIPSDHILISKLGKKYPDVKFIKTENASMAINMLSNGEVDAAISTKLTAKYYIEHYNPNELHYYIMPDIPYAEIAFAVPSDAYELRDILNKVLDDIPKEQIVRLSSKWLNMPNIQVDTWDMYKNEFYLVIFFSTLLIGSSLLWGVYLLKQTRMRKDSERNLQEQLNFSSTLSSSIPLPLYVITLSGELTKFNPAFSSFFSTTIQPQPGMFISESSHPLFPIFNTLQRDVESGLVKENIVSYNTQINNGSEIRYVTHWFTLFETSESTPPLLICGWKDMTESQNLTDALMVESVKAIDARQAKGVFLARMSHELRTPVSAIIGFLELIRVEKNAEIKDSNVELAYTTGQSLLRLIGDILDLEKIDSGNFDIQPEWVDFGSLLTSAVKMFDALAFKKGLDILQLNDVNNKYHLWFDPQAMRQVLANLIGNAIKFTEQGGISITASLTSKVNDAPLLVINITDSGPGISASEQEKLFQPYSQTSSGKLKVGSGLGLSICHEIIGLMAGRIFISKSTSQGTTFTIEVPTQLSEVAAISIDSPFAHLAPTLNNKLNVLIVDDNPTNLVLLHRQLANLGLTVDEAADGKQALAAINSKSYDLLITDINMPFLDGVELTQKIRTFDSEMLIWGLTADASQQERDRCLEVGLNLLLFKPINLQKLVSLLQTVKPRETKNALESIIDTEAFGFLSMGDPVLMKRILTHARDESERDLRGIQHAIASNDWAAAKHSLHRLAGTVQILGATAIVQRCEMLKQYLQADIKCPSIQLEIDELALQLELLFSAIDEFMAKPIL